MLFKNGGKMKIIKFNAVWCPSCLVSKSIWKKIKDEIKNIDIIEYDYDIDEDKVLEYNVGDKLPVVIKIGSECNEIGRLVGEKTYDEIISFIRE